MGHSCTNEGLDFDYTESLDRPWCPASLLFNGHQKFIAVVMRQGHDVDYLPQSKAEFKNSWSSASIARMLHNVVIN